ncbi:MAG TPA: 4-(cytidine 5'-diphospho)-2-C-methyl-D-erythritol kinase [Sphingomicrobium sp.]|nr:4-(cytidine 5'-diphospho)-2-C-methyl-D-erythritol kinase [Sphingomicrobium sp.]
MSEPVETAYAKLNLALHVREKRADGYHRIETLFVFCEDGDQLTAERADDISLGIVGPFAAELQGQSNLVSDAAAALRDASGTSAGAKLHLTKNLPIGSGLGGGSADAAAALRLLNRLWGLNWPIEKLEPVARALGSDVAPCLYSLPMRGEGRGDELESVDLGLAGRPMLLINPRTALSTADVFAKWDGVDRGPLEIWRAGRNDLEQPASELAPLIPTVLAWLGAQPGVECARMSGSGATCFALFDSERARNDAAEAVPREWWRLATRLR